MGIHFQIFLLFSIAKQLDEFRLEIQRRDQEILAMAAKMKTLEEQHQVSVSFDRIVGKIVLNDIRHGANFVYSQDYQRHISVLKESLCAKEEHYNMLQADVEELRTRLEEKNRLIEKKTQAAVQAVQERNRMSNELTELKDHMDIKDRKINVLQRKVSVDLADLSFLWFLCPRARTFEFECRRHLLRVISFGTRFHSGFGF